MPYVFMEELGEGMEAADVVERSDYDGVLSQRDEAISRAETAETAYEGMREKYANAFLTSPQRIKEDNERDGKRESSAQTYESLFSMKGENGAY